MVGSTSRDQQANRGDVEQQDGRTNGTVASRRKGQRKIE